VVCFARASVKVAFSHEWWKTVFAATTAQCKQNTVALQVCSP
jgi:hypothetical protein